MGAAPQPHVGPIANTRSRLDGSPFPRVLPVGGSGWNARCPGVNTGEAKRDRCARAYASVGCCAFMNPMDQQTAAVTGPAEGLGIALPFEEFFEAERGRLFRALLLITHDSTDAEDLMQEAFVRVWERWDRVGTLDDPVGYLFKTALNLRRSALRRATTAGRTRERRARGSRRSGKRRAPRRSGRRPRRRPRRAPPRWRRRIQGCRR